MKELSLAQQANLTVINSRYEYKLTRLLQHVRAEIGFHEGFKCGGLMQDSVEKE